LKNYRLFKESRESTTLPTVKGWQLINRSSTSLLYLQID